LKKYSKRKAGKKEARRLDTRSRKKVFKSLSLASCLSISCFLPLAPIITVYLKYDSGITFHMPWARCPISSS
jgi:hypothetical protein